MCRTVDCTLYEAIVFETVKMNNVNYCNSLRNECSLQVNSLIFHHKPKPRSLLMLVQHQYNTSVVLELDSN